MGVSSSTTTAEAARGGDTHIVFQGQTAGCYSNEPFWETKQGRENNKAEELKP